MTDEEDNIESDMTNDSYYNSSLQQSNIESLNEGKQFTVKFSGLITTIQYLEQQLRQYAIQIRECHTEKINHLMELDRFKNQTQKRYEALRKHNVEITEEKGQLKAENALHRIHSLTCGQPEDTVEEIRDEEIKRLKETIKELQNTIENLSSARTSSENDTRRNEQNHLGMIDKYKEELESLKSQYSKEHKEFMIESSAYKAQVLQLIQDNEKYCREIQQHKDKNITLEQNHFNYAQEKRMYQQSIRRLTSDCETLKLQCSESDKQTQKKKESFDQLFKVYEEERQRSDVLQSVKAQNENEINRLVAEVCSYQESLKAKEDDLIKKDEEIRLSQEQLRIYANDYERQQHEMRAVQRELSTTTRELERMRDEFTRRQQEQVHGANTFPANHQPGPARQYHHVHQPQQYPPGGGGININ